MRRLLGISLLSLAVAAGCGSPTDPDPRDVLAIRVDGADLVFTNHSRRELATFVIAADVMPGANWVFCPDVNQCDGQRPGATWRRPVASIYGLEPGREVVILWQEVALGFDGRRHLARSGSTSIRP